ncbi:uncharacterized protein LOC123696333 [Colias croceus]|uniref:uncharacterized protein LOC123696333 n=1 Tax=Colias crocea TaxID=72248 RepID=UPI001E27B5E2|nr:uncharacterized protein LOC123696333 [Colias croceus]
MKEIIKIILMINAINYAFASIRTQDESYDNEIQKIEMLSTLITKNLQPNGRNIFLFAGVFPDQLYIELKRMNVCFTVTDIEKIDEQIEDVVPYPSNTIVLNCYTLKQFENAMLKLVTLPYWHPLANVILFYHFPYDKLAIANIFFAFWYFKAINAIIMQYDDMEKVMYISYYNPYISEYFMLENNFGCWTTRKVSIPVRSFENGFQCELGCYNVSLHSKFRTNNLGTCIGFETYSIKYGEKEAVKDLKVFHDVSKDLHNYTMIGFAVQIKPFLEIDNLGNGSYFLRKRDGNIWNTMARLMNFTIDISINKDVLYDTFNYEMNIREIVYFTQRKRDLNLVPLYQFDIMVVEVDNTVPFAHSGVCFMSHRADFETDVFDSNLFTNNYNIIIEFLLCFFCTWIAFVIFTIEQTKTFTLDQLGKDLVNCFRTVLSISLHKPPKRGSFRIFLSIAIWCFFVINFSSQAAIISLFSVLKKGKEVDTFEDILAKDYKIEGIASPDVVLPDNEERFRKINSKVVAVQNMFTCPNRLKNDSQRFCIIDCAFGRYLERNWLNDKGEQYLHVARQDRIHSHYLQMILPKHSPITERYNKYMLGLFEAGLINKWMEYRFNDIKEEAPVKALGINDLKGIFQCYCFLLGGCSLVFIIEFISGMRFWYKVTNAWFIRASY